VGTRLQFVQVYAADQAKIRSMVTDDEYITERAKATGALTVTHTRTAMPDGSVDLVIVRTLPADMPSYARSFVGETLTITEHQVWLPRDDPQGSARFDVRFSAPLTFTGMVAMGSDGTTTSVTTSGEIKASIPFVGGKIEALALEQTERYLRKEQEFADGWLARGGIVA